MGHSRFAGQIARYHRPVQRFDHHLPEVAQLGAVLLHPGGKHRAVSDDPIIGLPAAAASS
jgi:hypothetical protein